MVIIDFLLFIVGILFAILAFSLAYLPLLYGFPKALFRYFKKRIKLKAALVYLTIAIGWNIGFVILFTLLAIFTPRIYGFLVEESLFYWGTIIGFWFGVFGLIFRKSAREDAAKDFEDFVARYKLPTNNFMEKKALKQA